MAAEVLFVTLLAVVVGVFLYWQFPDATERWFRRLQTFRTVVFGILSVVIALVLISTGVLSLMFVGFLLLVFGVVWILFEEPQEEILGVVGR